MKKHRLTLTYWGPYDGGVDVIQDNWPGPDHPYLEKIFEGFLDRELDVIIHENQITFTLVTKPRGEEK